MSDELRAHLESLIPGACLEWQQITATLEGLLIEPDSGSRPLPPNTESAVMEAPPFWSLLWPSGECFCRLLTPDLVEGRSVLDFGAGCGLVAAAAALAGASRVAAVDCDPASQLASRVNAAHNGASVEVREWWEGEPFDTVLLADLLYDESNLPLLDALSQAADEVVIIDSRLGELKRPGFHHLGTRAGVAVPDLDPHREFGTLNFWYYGQRPSRWRSVLSGDGAGPSVLRSDRPPTEGRHRGA